MNVVSLQPKHNSYFSEPHIKKKMANSIIVFFLAFELLYGLDFGFINILNKKLRPLWKCILFMVTVILNLCLYLWPFGMHFEIDLRFLSSLIILGQYLGHVIFLRVTKYKVCNFLKDLRTIELVSSKENRVGWIACISFMISLLYRLVDMYYSHLLFDLESYNITVFMLYVMSSVGLDHIWFVQIIIYYYFYNAVVHLKHLADDKLSDLNEIKKLYVFIADCYDNVETLYGNLVSKYFIF